MAQPLLNITCHNKLYRKERGMTPVTRHIAEAPIKDEIVPISSEPLYTQIREILRHRILDGSYPPHSQMPSEAQMIASFGVSRITIRQALSDLQKEGLIFKVMGKGTFVARPKAFQNLSRLQGFGEAMMPSGYEIYSQVLSAKRVAASALVAQHLKVKVEAPVFELQRLRYLNREPISVDVSYFPAALGERLAQEDLATKDVFSILENNFGQNLTHAEVQIEAVPADELQARHLKTAEGAPLLRIERLTFAGKTPVDYEFLYYLGDAFQYRLRIDRT